ncbi:type I glyceraldehyde-3-phosphate dehydrogenase [Cryptosporangium arvum]|uniref:Glyceraldehyde-3-phosphate dehydrogenase (NAD+) n=1 Tax=Cryptosporangium arvum DSM 44712 TaxID=927661 RepID=A0A011AKG3_9ACTN|nr:type I glyceraldehyde-3-phosphate dehydrogenase [Cryptosporangium arvum]EXG82461.1 glyceraldehyde-3-phosphate dehydrogenase (NAD+) [Cryptosporangium arvum DSM 44712]
MSVRIGINGFGRVGRCFYRIARARGLDVVAVNDLTAPATLAHLLTYDSTFGRLDTEAVVTDDGIAVGDSRFAVTAERDPAALDWGAYGVDLVIESTGRFRARDDAAVHLKSGPKKVLISAPGKNADATVVLGVNEETYDPGRHDVVSNASCTTNCVAPMAKVLNDAFGVERGLMTTIHAYTNDQSLLDAPHKDLRRARSAASSMIPTSTGAAKAVGLVVPELAGKLGGVAVRVPIEDGSLTDLTVQLRRDVTADEVNRAFADAAVGRLNGYLRYSTAPIVSRDIVGDPASCVFDAPLTQADGPLVKVFGWYDNEWGYSARLVDLAEYVAARF